MQILALDIGGTYTRLAHCRVESGQDFAIEHTHQRPTPTATDGGFGAVIKAIGDTDTQAFLPVGDYDAVAIAIAGPVLGNKAWPPNMDWSLDLSRHHSLPRFFLLNDFVAQAYCLRDKLQRDNLITLRQGRSAGGHCAVVGAGTGLGHCLLVPNDNSYKVLPSEAGQAGFLFNDSERDIAAFFGSELKQDIATNDQVVSGPGLELLHQCIQGEEATAVQICAAPDKNRATLDQFARFYGRACREFCLSAYVTDTLILSGGIAARNPWLVDKPVFMEEFDLSATHRYLLESIGICLNSDEQLGIQGIIRYSLEQLFPL